MMEKQAGQDSNAPSERNENARRAWVEPEAAVIDMKLAEIGGTL